MQMIIFKAIDGGVYMALEKDLKDPEVLECYTDEEQYSSTVLEYDNEKDIIGGCELDELFNIGCHYLEVVETEGERYYIWSMQYYCGYIHMADIIPYELAFDYIMNIYNDEQKAYDVLGPRLNQDLER